MPDYRVEFPDKQVWTIAVKGKKGKAALKVAHQRAAAARAAAGKRKKIPFAKCVVQKMTAQLRAEIKGLPYLTPAQLLSTCKKIGNEYQRKGMALTLRGMYYQLVSRRKSPSGQKEYNRVKSTLSSARLRGTFPLDMLSDSSRTLHPGDTTRYDLDVDNALEQAEEWVPKLDRFFIEVSKWYRQRDLPIVLFEKEALTNVFGPTCRELGISWMATKGYPSWSTLYEIHKLMVRSADPYILEQNLHDLGYGHLQDLNPNNKDDLEELLAGHQEAVDALQRDLELSHWADDHEEGDGPVEHTQGLYYRFTYGDLTAREWHQGTGQVLRLLYFGDHDPDGMEIPDDLERRLRVIQVRTGTVIPFTLERLGLNRDQVEKYDLPPFWAKSTSARYDKYIDNYSWVQDRAWELDALDPSVLRKITEDAVEGYFDDAIYRVIREAVDEAREAFNSRIRDEILDAL